MPPLEPIEWSVLVIALACVIAFAASAVRAWRWPRSNEARELSLVVSVSLFVIAASTVVATWVDGRDLHARGLARVSSGGALLVLAAYHLVWGPLRRR